MIGKWLKSYFVRFSETRFPIDELFRRRSASKGIPRLTEGEFFSCLNYDELNIKDIKDAYKDRDFTLASERLLDYFSKKDFPFFRFKDKENIIRKIKSIPYSYKYVVDNAEKICSHSITLPTGHTADFGTFINWFSDFGGKSWMFLHISDFMKKLHDKSLMKQYDINDLSVSLEFNKHHHLTELGRAFFLTSDEKYTQEFVVELEDWIERNPVNWGISWLDPMTVAQRLISWIFALGFFINSTYIRGEDFYIILKNILLHGAYLAEAMNERVSRPSRMIACATSLYLLGTFFPEFDCVKLWQAKAARVLDSEAASQFTSDGVYRERSMGMQMLLTEFFLLTIIADRLTGKPTSPSVFSVAERSLSFMQYTLTPYGKPIVFGDVPITHVWRFSIMPHEDFKNLFCLGAVIFNRGDMKFSADSLYEDLIWFFGNDGEQMLEHIQSHVPSHLSAAFVEGGFFNFRDSWTKDATSCLFLASPKKRFAAPDKGIDLLIPHRDLMSFALTIRGEPFIIETGAYKGKKKQFIPYFPATSAHNSLIIDGKEQTLSRSGRGGKKYMHLLKTRWLFSDEFDYVMSGNAGFEDLRSLVVHRRELIHIKDKKWFIIKDTLEGTDTFNVVSMFQFAPELEIILRGDFGCLIRGRREFMRMNPYYPGEFSCKPSRGRLNPMSGWYARDICKIEPCQRIDYYSKIQLPAQLYMWVSWARGEFRVPSKEELEAYFVRASGAAGMREEEVPLELFPSGASS